MPAPLRQLRSDRHPVQLLQPLARVEQCLVLPGEGEQEFSLSPGMVERAARNRRNPTLLHKEAGEFGIGHAKAGNVREDVVCSFGQLAVETRLVAAYRLFLTGLLPPRQ